MKKVKIFIMITVLIALLISAGCVNLATLYLLPDSEGDSQRWTPSTPPWHWLMVDDPVASPDEDATYVYTNQTAQVEEFNHASSALLSAANISNVRIVARARKTNAMDTMAVELGIKLDIRYPAPFNNPVSTSYSNYVWDWATCPMTGSAWTKSDIDILQSSVMSVIAGFPFGQLRMTQVYFIVTYTIIPVGRPKAGATIGLTHII